MLIGGEVTDGGSVVVDRGDGRAGASGSADVSSSGRSGLVAMSEPQARRARPRSPLAGWLVMGGSVVVVLMALDQVAGLHSLDTREAVEEYLSEPPGDGSGSACRAC